MITEAGTVAINIIYISSLDASMALIPAGTELWQTAVSVYLCFSAASDSLSSAALGASNISIYVKQ